MSFNFQDEFVDLEGALELAHYRNACRTSQSVNTIHVPLIVFLR